MNLALSHSKLKWSDAYVRRNDMFLHDGQNSNLIRSHCLKIFIPMAARKSRDCQVAVVRLLESRHRNTEVLEHNYSHIFISVFIEIQ